MPEMGTSGLMSGDGKRGGRISPFSRPSSPLPAASPLMGTLLIPVPRAFRHDRGRETGFHSLGPAGRKGGPFSPPYERIVAISLTDIGLRDPSQRRRIKAQVRLTPPRGSWR